jgi:hypothetical protein
MVVVVVVMMMMMMMMLRKRTSLTGILEPGPRRLVSRGLSGVVCHRISLLECPA